MFTQLKQLLEQSRQFSNDYWHDCALFEAESCLQSFQAQDWLDLENCLPEQSAYWKLRCIDTLHAFPSVSGLTVLAALCDDNHKETALAAARSLLDLNKKNCWPSEIASSLQYHLHKAQTTVSKHSLFDALHRRFFFKPAA